MQQIIDARPARRERPTGCALAAAVLAVALVLTLACVLIWPFVQTTQRLYEETVSANADVLRAVLLVALVLLIMALVLAVLAGVRALTNLARRVAVVRLQNQAPIDVRDVRRDEIRAVVGASVHQHYDVERERARQPHPALTSLTNSPHLVIKNDPRALPDPDASAPALPIAIPTFAELVAAGKIGPRLPLVLGVDVASGELVTGKLDRIYSPGVGGLQGSGKTWTVVCQAAQIALHGGRFIIGDPHAGDSESLATRLAGLRPAFLCDVAKSDKEILSALKLALTEFNRRKGGDVQRWPLVVLLDEWTALQRGELAAVLAEIVESFSEEGRKYETHVWLLSQRWDKAAVGAFRNTLTSAWIHRMRSEEARMLTGLRSEMLPDDTLQLPDGVAYFLDTRGQLVKLATPRMAIEDLDAVGRYLGGPFAPPAAAPAERPPIGFRPPPRTDPVAVASVTQSATSQPRVSHTPPHDYSASGRAETWTPEEARVIALFEDGYDPGAIVTEITGMTSKAGKPYMKKLADVSAVLRRAMLARKGTSS